MNYEILGAFLALSIYLMFRYYMRWREDVKITKLTQENTAHTVRLKKLRGIALTRLCEDHDLMEQALKRIARDYECYKDESNSLQPEITEISELTTVAHDALKGLNKHAEA